MKFALLFVLAGTEGARIPRGLHQGLSSRTMQTRDSSLAVRPRAPLQMSADGLVEASYNLAGGTATFGLLCGILEDRKGPLAKLFGAGAIIFTLLGGFFAYQTSQLSFKFDDDSFSLVKNDGSSMGENVVVGGENDWKYSSFVNYAFLPSEDFPILVYFKETQTPRDVWVEAPIVVDALEGQAHFFPAIARSDELKAGFEQHVGEAASSKGPKLKSTSRLTL